MADHEPSGMAREDDGNDDMEDEDEDGDGDDGKGGSKVKNPATVFGSVNFRAASLDVPGS